MFPEEYRLDIEEIKVKRANLLQRTAEMKQTHAITRELYAIGTLLDTMLIQRLDLEELKELESKEGGRWFAREFEQFRVTDKI
jgi:hypothetical protein